MKHLVSLAVVCLIAVPHAAGQPKPTTLVTGLNDPTGVAIGAGSKIYVAVHRQSLQDADGAIMLIDKGKAVPFATGFKMPGAMVAYQNLLFVTGLKPVFANGKDIAEKSIWRVDAKGNAELFVPPSAFPSPTTNLRGMTVDPESGTLFVSEGTLDGKDDGRVLRISPKGKVDVIVDAKRFPALGTPEGLAMDGASHLLMSNITNSLVGFGGLYRIKLADRTLEIVADGFGARGIAWDHN